MTVDTAHAIRLHAFGGPELMCLEPIDLPPPAAGEVPMRHTAIGFEDIDV